MAPDEDVSKEKIWFAVFVLGNVAILSFARTLRPWDQPMRGQSFTIKGLWRSIISVLLLSSFLVFGISYHRLERAISLLLNVSVFIGLMAEVCLFVS